MRTLLDMLDMKEGNQKVFETHSSHKGVLFFTIHIFIPYVYDDEDKIDVNYSATWPLSESKMAYC